MVFLLSEAVMTSNPFIEFESKTINPDLPTVFDISPEELHRKKSDVKIIDVRRLEEWVGEYGHIQEAELMTLNTLPTKINELPKNRTVVFVCRSGGRSAQATAFALEHGLLSVYNMRGGMIEWTKNNFETIQRNGA